MIRKLSIGLVAVASLVLMTFAPSANAQTPTPTTAPCDYANYIAYNCAGQAGGYPAGGFGSSATPTPKPTSTPMPTSSAVVSADTVDATATAGGASIAFTGSESRVLGYAGASLIGFGAIALAVARRKSDTDLD